MNTASASSHESKASPTRTPRPSCDASVYVNNATRSDPLLGYAHDLIGDPMFYGTAIRPLTVGFTRYYRF